MDWFIPLTGELTYKNWVLSVGRNLIPSCTVPPGVIEASIGETGHFCEYIEDTFENDVKCKQIESDKTGI